MRFSSAVLCAASSVLLASTRVSASGGGEFAISGAPTMTVVAGLCFVALSIFKGISHSGSDITASASNLGGAYLLLNVMNVIFAVFMLFGPSPSLGPRVSILGFQILMGCCIGFYATYTNNRAATIALFVYELVCCLCLVGSMPLLNFSTPLFAVEPTGCLSYFDNTDQNYNRCWDLGFLQLLRAFGMFSLFIMILQTAMAFVAATDGGAKGAAGEALMGHAGFGEQQGTAYVAPAAHAEQHAAPATAPAAGTPGYQAL